MTQPTRKPRPITSAPFERGDHVELAERLIMAMRGKSPTVHVDGQWYAYEPPEGVFKRVEPARLSRAVQRFAGAELLTSKDGIVKLKASDVHGTVKLASDQVAEPAFFAAAAAGIAFRDGFVQVSATKITRHEHSPDHRARFAYPFDFAELDAPIRLLRFFADVFRDDEDRNDKVALIQEYFGASLLGLATRYQRALVFVGDGANGKGVLSSIAERCFPPDSTCSIPPQDVGQEYRRATLAGKLLNIVSELPEADILDSESWKSVVVGDSMTAREIRQSPFTFRPIAGHIYSANRLPGTTDQTHGFWRRLVVVPFGRIFSEAEQNPRLVEEILEAETPAIVGWMLAGAQRVLAQGRYTVPRSSAEAKDRWQAAADQVRAFLEECCVDVPLEAHVYDWTVATELYRCYRGWAAENGNRPLASRSFGERMRLIGKPSKHVNSGRYYPVRVG